MGSMMSQIVSHRDEMLVKKDLQKKLFDIVQED
jgi:hypothetical protein